MTALDLLEETPALEKNVPWVRWVDGGVILEDPLLSFALAILLTGSPPQPATQFSCSGWKVDLCWISFLEDLGLPPRFPSLPVG